MKAQVLVVIRWIVLAAAQMAVAVLFVLVVTWASNSLKCAQSDMCALLPDPGQEGYLGHVLIVLVFGIGTVLLNSRIAPKPTISIGAASCLLWGALIVVAVLEDHSRAGYAIAAAIGGTAALWLDRRR